MDRNSLVRLASGMASAAIALGMVLPAPAYGQQAVATAEPLAHIIAELEIDEQAEFVRFRSALTSDEQNALIDVASRLPMGARGLFVAKLLMAPPDQQKGMTRFMAVLTPNQRPDLTARLAGHPPALWDALFRYVAIVPANEAVAMMFEPTFTQSALVYRYMNRTGDEGLADSLDMVEAAKDANLEAAEDFERSWNPPPAISGGTIAPPHSAPWQVQIYKAGASASPLDPRERRYELANYGRALENFQRWHDCGGVLISQGWVLTAAHCIKKPRLGPYVQTRRIRTGTDDITEGGTTWRIAAVVKHGGYNRQSKRDDIALIRIAADGQTDLSRNQAAKPIPMATRSHVLRSGERLIVTGWGVTRETEIGSKYLDRYGLAKRPSSVLLQAVVLNQPLGRCNNNPNYRKVRAALAQGQICAGGDRNGDACQGDSGGPLVRTRRNGGSALVGLVSFGPGCGLDDTPGAYVDVRHYGDWIRGAMKRARANRIVDWPPAH